MLPNVALPRPRRPHPALMLIVTCSAVHAMNLPDPLLCADGTRADSSAQWEAVRRDETLRLFEDHVYGRQTVGRPSNMTFSVVQTDPDAMDGEATLKIVDIGVRNDQDTDGLTIRVTLFIPNDVPHPVPGFILINNRSAANTDPTRSRKSDFWPAEEIVERGYVIAAFRNSDTDPDFNDFTNGVHRVFDGGTRVDEGSWGALSAWAWGASRAMDYFETDPDIDHTRFAVVGHSRGGKAALVTGAYDTRYRLAVSNCSGEAGAALARRYSGESLASIVGGFPHWFCSKYATYADNVESLPIDQHQLIALMAPRAVYVASASEDSWADPYGEFLSLVHAAPVFSLYGATGMGDESWPAPNTPLRGDLMGYHMRDGGHDLTTYDWLRFADFFDTLRAAEAGPPDAPTDLAAIADDRTAWLTTREVTLSWIDPADSETGFRIERRDIPAGPWTEVGATLTPDAGSFTDATVEPGTEYWYRVCAYNASGSSEWSLSAAVAVSPLELRQPDNPTATVNGIAYEYYEGSWKSVPSFDELTPVSTGALDGFLLSIPGRAGDYFAVRYHGYIEAPAEGSYTLSTSSDDGSLLYVGSHLVVDNDGTHGATERSGRVALAAGLHEVTLGYFEDWGGNSLNVTWEGPGITPESIPLERLFRSTARVPRAPVVAFTTPAFGQVLSGTTHVNAIAYDPDAGTGDGSGIQRVTFELRRDGRLLDTRIENIVTYDWTLDTTGYADGVYTIVATAAALSPDGGAATSRSLTVRFLQNNSADRDIDGDGLPDWWERQADGSDTGTLPYDDPDGDGADNIDEFLNDTDPHDPGSAPDSTPPAGPDAEVSGEPAVFSCTPRGNPGRICAALSLALALAASTVYRARARRTLTR